MNRSGRARRRFRPLLEALEDRLTPTVTGAAAGGTTFVFALSPGGTFEIDAGVTGAAPATLAIPFGGAANDQARGVARDAAGTLYVTGAFVTTVDFDPGAGTYNLTSA